MGHYRSEMITEDEIREDNKRFNRWERIHKALITWAQNDLNLSKEDSKYLVEKIEHAAEIL